MAQPLEPSQFSIRQEFSLGWLSAEASALSMFSQSVFRAGKLGSIAPTSLLNCWHLSSRNFRMT
jgi:hypothetical protein